MSKSYLPSQNHQTSKAQADIRSQESDHLKKNSTLKANITQIIPKLRKHSTKFYQKNSQTSSNRLTRVTFALLSNKR